MSKILVTGGAGFIGSHLVDRLVAEGHQVLVVDDLSRGRRENLAAAGARTELLVARAEDLKNRPDVLRDVEVVYHLAALISGYDSLHDPRAYVNENVVALLSVLEACRDAQVRRFVLASSATVYGNAEIEAKSEDDVPLPVTVYGLTKLAGEHLLRMYAPLWGFSPISLRLFNVYGPRQSPDHPYANVTCKFAHAAATGAPVRLYGDGSARRDFVFVDDVVEALVRAATPKPELVYNVGTGADASIRQLLDTVGELAGQALQVEAHPAWPNDVRAVRADVSRLERDFAFRPRIGLRDGLARTVRFFRNLPP